MTEVMDKSTEFEDIQDLLFKHPELHHQMTVIEVRLSVSKFSDLKKCTDAGEKLSKFFDENVLNAVMFDYEKPTNENSINGWFFASVPLTEKNFNLFLDLLVLNLVSAPTLAFNGIVTIRTEKMMYKIRETIIIDH